MPEIPVIVDGHIATTEAIAFLAQFLYPDEYESITRKRVRERIRYALKTNALGDHDSGSHEHLDAASFFDWAKTKWPVLREIDGLPTVPNSGELNGEIPALTGEMSLVVMPQDRAELEHLYSSAVSRLHRAERALSQCEKKVVALQEALERCREKDHRLRSVGSDSGKLGKRIPKGPR